VPVQNTNRTNKELTEDGEVPLSI